VGSSTINETREIWLTQNFVITASAQFSKPTQGAASQSGQATASFSSPPGGVYKPGQNFLSRAPSKLAGMRGLDPNGHVKLLHNNQTLVHMPNCL
jgi:hypothetical protein